MRLWCRNDAHKKNPGAPEQVGIVIPGTATIINATGTFLGVLGAILNALGSGAAFPLWLVSNALLLVLFAGIYKKRWTLNSGALFQIVLYSIYMQTSSYGTWRCYS